MPDESVQSWAEWNGAFEDLKVAHKNLRRLAHSADDPERREATREWVDARAAYNLTCAKIPV